MGWQRPRWEREKIQRESEKIHYLAHIHLELRAHSLLEVRHLLKFVLFPPIAQAAIEAGDVLHPADKQDNSITGYLESTDAPGTYRFLASRRFVSDNPSWQEASAWLRNALSNFHHEQITVRSMEKTEGFFD